MVVDTINVASGTIENGEDILDLLNVVGPKSSCLSVFKESLQSFVPERPDHGQTYADKCLLSSRTSARSLHRCRRRDLLAHR
jgi:hypothetical protein